MSAPKAIHAPAASSKMPSASRPRISTSQVRLDEGSADEGGEAPRRRRDVERDPRGDRHEARLLRLVQGLGSQRDPAPPGGRAEAEDRREGARRGVLTAP